MGLGALADTAADMTEEEYWLVKKTFAVSAAEMWDDGTLILSRTAVSVTVAGSRTVFAVDISGLPSRLRTKFDARMVARLSKVAGRGTIVLAMIWDPGRYSTAWQLRGWKGVVWETGRRSIGIGSGVVGGFAGGLACSASTGFFGTAGCVVGGIVVGAAIGIVAEEVYFGLSGGDWADP